MADFNLRTRDGALHRVAARVGAPLMELIRAAGFDELLATCGGNLSCATCHVYVESLPEGAELPPLSRDEDGLLDGSDHRQANSRLACQIPFHPYLCGATIVVAPEE